VQRAVRYNEEMTAIPILTCYRGEINCNFDALCVVPCIHGN